MRVSNEHDTSTEMKTLPLLTVLAVLLAPVGCATVDPNADPIVVNAERLTGIALDTFDTFLKIEYENRDRLLAINKEIHEAAEFFRHNAVEWLSTARALTKAYKSNRSPQNKANLETAVAILQTGVLQAQKYIAQSKGTP